MGMEMGSSMGRVVVVGVSFHHHPLHLPASHVMRRGNDVNENVTTHQRTRRSRLRALPDSRAHRRTQRSQGGQRGPGTKQGSRMVEAWSLHEHPVSAKRWS